MTDAKPQSSLFHTVLRHPISLILLHIIILIAAVALIKELISKPILGYFFISDVTTKSLTALIGSGVMIGTYLSAVKYLEKKASKEFNIDHAPKELTQGLIIGMAAIGFTILLLAMMGYYEFIEIKSISRFAPTLAFIFGAAILEEIIFRGLFYRIIYTWKGPLIALLISSVMFQIPHFMNSHTGVLPATLGVLFGLIVALMYAYTNRLWLPIGFHFGWNILQPAFGTTLSGVSEFTTLSEARLDGPAIFIGNNFGIEVSVFSFISLLVIGYYYYRRLSDQGYFKFNL